MKTLIRKGTTSKLCQFFVNDSSVTNGAGLSGLSASSASLTAYYYREGDTVTTQIAMTNSSLGVWASGGLVQPSAANLPGVYQLGVPDAALATGASSVVLMLKGAASMSPVLMEFQLVDFNPDDSVRMGLTALPNAAAGANGGLPTGDASGRVTVGSMTADVITASVIADNAIDAGAIAANAITSAKIAADAIGASQIADGAIDAGAIAANAITSAKIATDAIGAAQIAADAIGSSELAASAVTEIQSGLATAAAVTAVQADTDDIQTRLPAALVGGRMDSDVQAMAAGIITAAVVATGAIDADAVAADAVTEIQSGLATAVALAAVQTDTDAIEVDTQDIQSRLPAALVGGRIDASVGAMAAGVLTAAAIAADAITAAKIATGAIDADALASDAVDEIWAKAMTDISAVPGMTGSVLSAINWMFAVSRNRRTQTATVETVYRDDGTTSLSTSAKSDDGTTFTRAEYA